MKRGVHGYATIVRELQKSDLTMAELIAVLGMTQPSPPRLRQTVGVLLQRRVLRICSWRRKAGKSGPPAMVLSASPGEDAPYPVRPTWDGKGITRERAKPTAFLCRPELAVFLAMWDAMQGDAVSSIELAEVSGQTVEVTRQALRHMRRIGLIHIHAWDRNTRLWKAGTRADAKRPPPKTTQAISRDRYVRLCEARRFTRIEMAFREAA